MLLGAGALQLCRCIVPASVARFVGQLPLHPLQGCRLRPTTTSTTPGRARRRAAAGVWRGAQPVGGGGDDGLQLCRRRVQQPAAAGDLWQRPGGSGGQQPARAGGGGAARRRFRLWRQRRGREWERDGWAWCLKGRCVRVRLGAGNGTVFGGAQRARSQAAGRKLGLPAAGCAAAAAPACACFGPCMQFSLWL